MFEQKTVAVVVPCYNEQTQIVGVLAGMPPMVDCIIVVDDCSTDGTAAEVRKFQESGPGLPQRSPGDPAAPPRSPEEPAASRVVLLRHERNQGVGAAIVTGYREAVRRGLDVVAVMAGDGQMPPDELESLVAPVARGQCDYAKGNRIFYQGAWDSIPRHRYFGNGFFSMLTKIASGYWHVADSQTGYTAISRRAMESIDLRNVYPRYGYPNDMLVRLNVCSMRVRDVPIRPVYNVGERSKMRLWLVGPRISWLIFKGFCWRMKEKYIVRDFHPLVFFYLFGGVAFLVGFLFGLYLVAYRLFVGSVAPTSALFSAILVMAGLQLLLFAMWFDMETNKDLK